MSTEQALRELMLADCVQEKRVDERDGLVKSGWWQDGVYLAKNARDAVAALKG